MIIEKDLLENTIKTWNNIYSIDKGFFIYRLNKNATLSLKIINHSDILPHFDIYPMSFFNTSSYGIDITHISYRNGIDYIYLDLVFRLKVVQLDIQ